MGAPSASLFLDNFLAPALERSLPGGGQHVPVLCPDAASVGGAEDLTNGLVRGGVGQAN